MFDFSTRVNQKIGLRSGNRSFSGFTLVEILVVSVIVAILAAVAIPVYSGYVRTQRIEQVNSLALTASVAANIYYRRNSVPPTLAQLDLFYDPAKFSITVSDPNVIVTDMTDATITKTVGYRTP